MKHTIFFTILLTALFKCGFGQPFSTESQWDSYFTSKSNALDPIEGIWNSSSMIKVYEYGKLVSSTDGKPHKVAIYKSGNSYQTYRFDEVKESGITFSSTAVGGVYIVEIQLKGVRNLVKSNVTLTGNGLIQFTVQMPYEFIEQFMGPQQTRGISANKTHNWIKLSPRIENRIVKQKSTGTGFAIANNGVIVTNHHVVEGASRITVRGINGNFFNSKEARIVVTDKNNDLVLLQIIESGFTLLNDPPYHIGTRSASVGEGVFVLGYPLTATMGDEIKLTNGIISSKSGYQGDATSYQISAPVQSGNSGAPLFDNSGAIIGIVSAKHTGAENAGYAVKTQYLTNLMDLTTFVGPKVSNKLLNKTLPEQVGLVKDFIYIIEAE